MGQVDPAEKIAKKMSGNFHNKPVLVTGSTGYLASWIVKSLLEKGITVHATMRGVGNKAKRKHLDDIAKAVNGKIKYFEADLLSPGSFDSAMEGCEIVFHTASPFFLNSKDPQQELIDPALNGTKNILESVNNSGSVKRVVLTSSVAAIYGDTIDGESIEGGVFDETMWNTSSNLKQSQYNYSKTLAEKEAWRMNEKQNKWSLVVINPSLVFGPALNIHSDFSSKSIMLQICNGDMRWGTPDLTYALTDVRDVATAHMNAAFNNKTIGRYIISSGSINFLDIGKILIKNFGSDYPFPKFKAPKILFWLIAPLFGVKRKFVSRNVGYPLYFDNSKSKKQLGMDYIPIEKTIIDFFQQLLDEKIVQV